MQLGEIERLRNTLTDGAIMFLDSGEIASGSKLALKLIENYKNLLEKPSNESIQRLMKIFSHYKIEENDTSKSIFIYECVDWSKQPENNNQGSPQIHSIFANHYFERNEFEKAQNHFIRSDDMSSFSSMLLKWQSIEISEEQESFLTRSILLLLALGDLQNANLLFKIHSSKLTIEQKSLPAYNFCHFLLLTLERDAYDLFLRLKTAYSITLSKDPSYAEYLDQIAQIFYNISNQNSGLAQILSSFFK